MLNEILLHILNNYPTEKGKSSKNHPLATFFRQNFEKQLEQLVDTDTYEIDSEYDLNYKWVEIPVVTILNKKITDSRKTGFYIAYIFSSIVSILIKINSFFNESISLAKSILSNSSHDDLLLHIRI